jgi:hypothetical protein
LQRDKDELDVCVKNNLSKSTILLAGSIIETVLVHFFLTFPSSELTEKEIMKADLQKLVNWAGNMEIISNKTRDLATVVKNYRNLIHPRKDLRMLEEFSMNHAMIAANLVEIFIKEINKKYNEKIKPREQFVPEVNTDQDQWWW